MFFSTDICADKQVISLSVRRLDMSIAEDFLEGARAQIPVSTKRLVIDVTGLEFLDSSGLGALVAIRKIIGQDGTVELVGASPHVRRILQLTKLEKYLGMS